MEKPKLIVIGGFAGAGKTTLANRLSSEHNYSIFSSDKINDALRLALNREFKEVSPIAYKVMWLLVREQLSNGVSVIIDTNMAAARTWASLDNIKRDFPEINVYPVILQATLKTHRLRIEDRGRTNKEHLNLGGDKLEDVLFKYNFIEKLNRPDIVRISAEGTPESAYDAVEELILGKQLS